MRRASAGVSSARTAWMARHYTSLHRTETMPRRAPAFVPTPGWTSTTGAPDRACVRTRPAVVNDESWKIKTCTGAGGATEASADRVVQECCLRADAAAAVSPALFLKECSRPVYWPHCGRQTETQRKSGKTRGGEDRGVLEASTSLRKDGSQADMQGQSHTSLLIPCSLCPFAFDPAPWPPCDVFQ